MERLIYDDDRKTLKDKIDRLIHKDVRDGSVLLIGGLRGAGKTRLVDEVLTHKSKWWKWSGRKKRHEIRQPRKGRRVILKVNVDANFPESGPDAEHRKREDPNAFALMLLRNLVFSITSVVDARWSWRLHGRVLSRRIGYLNYLFNPASMNLFVFTAVLGFALPISMVIAQVPTDHMCGFAAYFLPSIALILFARIAFRVLSFFMIFTSVMLLNLSAGLLFLLQIKSLFFLYLFVACTLAIAVIVYAWWLLMTLINWRFLSRASSYLYDLVHAEDTRQRISNRLRKFEVSVQGKMQFSALAISILLAFVFRSYLGESARVEWVVGLLLGFFGVSLLYLLVTFRSSHLGNETHFGQDNPVWMIEKIRRYLYILHQCGIEPVIVFDELDKLEIWDEANKPEQRAWGRYLPGNDASETQYQPWHTLPAQLKRFVEALMRLRDGLGTDFLFILIGGDKLYKSLQDERATVTDGMGPLATLISDEMFLGPFDPSALCSELLGQRNSRCADCMDDVWRMVSSCFIILSCFKAAQTAGIRHAELCAIWLQAHGMLSNMQRIAAEKNRHFDKDDAEKMVTWMKKIWQPDDIAGQLVFIDTQGVLNQPWVLSWMHLGMLSLVQGSPLPSHSDVKNGVSKLLNHPVNAKPDALKKDILHALHYPTPKLLLAVGQYVLYGYLTDVVNVMNPDEGIRRARVNLDQSINLAYG